MSAVKKECKVLWECISEEHNLLSGLGETFLQSDAWDEP